MASNQASEASMTEASFNEWKALIESSLSRVSDLIGSVTREVEHLKIAVNSYSPSILTTHPSSSNTTLKKPLKARRDNVTHVKRDEQEAKPTGEIENEAMRRPKSKKEKEKGTDGTNPMEERGAKERKARQEPKQEQERKKREQQRLHQQQEERKRKELEKEKARKEKEERERILAEATKDMQIMQPGSPEPQSRSRKRKHAENADKTTPASTENVGSEAPGSPATVKRRKTDTEEEISVLVPDKEAEKASPHQDNRDSPAAVAAESAQSSVKENRMAARKHKERERRLAEQQKRGNSGAETEKGDLDPRSPRPHVPEGGGEGQPTAPSTTEADEREASRLRLEQRQKEFEEKQRQAREKKKEPQSRGKRREAPREQELRSSSERERSQPSTDRDRNGRDSGRREETDIERRARLDREREDYRRQRDERGRLAKEKASKIPESDGDANEGQQAPSKRSREDSDNGEKQRGGPDVAKQKGTVRKRASPTEAKRGRREEMNNWQKQEEEEEEKEDKEEEDDKEEGELDPADVQESANGPTSRRNDNKQRENKNRDEVQKWMKEREKKEGRRRTAAPKADGRLPRQPRRNRGILPQLWRGNDGKAESPAKDTEKRSRQKEERNFEDDDQFDVPDDDDSPSVASTLADEL